jgi:hypothetical protein
VTDAHRQTCRPRAAIETLPPLIGRGDRVRTQRPRARAPTYIVLQEMGIPDPRSPPPAALISAIGTVARTRELRNNGAWRGAWTGPGRGRGGGQEESTPGRRRTNSAFGPAARHLRLPYLGLRLTIVIYISPFRHFDVVAEEWRAKILRSFYFALRLFFVSDKRDIFPRRRVQSPKCRVRPPAYS